MRKLPSNYRGSKRIFKKRIAILVVLFLAVSLLVVLLVHFAPKKDLETGKITRTAASVHETRHRVSLKTHSQPPKKVLRLMPEMDLDIPVQEGGPEPTLEGQALYESWIDELCQTYTHIRPALIKAQVFNESSYDPNSLSSAGCIGLMQINPKWFGALMEELGVTDLYDPYSNLLVGICYMDSLMEVYQDEAMSLMAYNGGTVYARQKQARGEVTYYASHIIEMADALERGEE